MRIFSLIALLVIPFLLTSCIQSATRGMPDQRIAVIADPEVKGRSIAMPRSCPKWEENMGDGLENEYPAHFGCAQNYNLAKMIAEPDDLVRGRSPSPADAGPGILSIERYRSDKKKQLIDAKDLGIKN